MEDETGHDEFRSLCMAIGFVVLNWAIVEQQIDIWVNVAFKNCGGRALRKKDDIPRSFSLKVKFLKECFKKLTPLKPFATEGLELIKRASILACDRNKLVHAGLVSLKTENGAFQFRRIEYMKDEHAVSPSVFGPDDWTTLETALGDLIPEQLALSQKLADRFPG